MDKTNLKKTPRQITITDDIIEDLYNNHTFLGDLCRVKFKLDASVFDVEHIEKWFSVIKKKLSQFRDSEDDTWTDEFIQIAAFLGAQIEVHLKGEWRLDNIEGKKICKLVNINSETITEMDVLDLLIKEYMGEMDTCVYFKQLVD